MSGEHDFTNDLLFIINERQQVTYNDLSEIAFSRGIPENELKDVILQLETSKRIASRNSGGIMTYYILDEGTQINKVLIVEDDKSISKLMAITIGKGFNVSQIYDGGEAMSFIRANKPDLVVLDLMLPNKNGLDICQTIKSDPELSNTIVILVSAMDPTSNRFKGIEYGADYYVRKPFDPGEIRALVTIFLRKKGKRFDALIDLPDEERISKEIERSIKENGEYVIGTLTIDNLGVYARRFGNQSAMVILRLVSQLLQDIIRTKTKVAFVGFLNNTEFVIAGMKENVDNLIKEVKGEFDAVMPFILQDAGFKSINMSDIESLFESKEIPKLSIKFAESEKEKLKERRDAILKDKGVPANNLGSYTYEELEKLFSDQNLDIKITRDPSGVRLQVGRKG